MSVITYNGISLPYASCTNFGQEAVYGVHNTDWHLTKFDITVQCFVNTNYLSLLAPDMVVNGIPITTNPVDIMRVIRSRLLHPRKTLSFKINQSELIPQAQPGNPGTVDSENGPKPQSCNIIELTGTMFLIHYRITANYWENNTVVKNAAPFVTNQIGNDVLYNRWTETVDIDNCQYSTKTREGKYIIRSDNKSGLIADSYRYAMAVVGVDSGFLRKSAQYTVSPDGLSLSYTITDKEVFKYPPKPAFEASGNYYETAPNKGGSVRYGEVRLTLKGDKLTPQAALLKSALTIALAKLLVNNAKVNLIEGTTINVDMYENIVQVQMKCFLNIDKGRVAGQAAFNRPALLLTPGSDPPTNPNVNAQKLGIGIQPTYYTRGTAGAGAGGIGLLLKAAAYYDPSLVGTVIDKNTDGFTGNLLQVGQAGKTKEP